MICSITATWQGQTQFFVSFRVIVNRIVKVIFVKVAIITLYSHCEPKSISAYIKTSDPEVVGLQQQKTTLGSTSFSYGQQSEAIIGYHWLTQTGHLKIRKKNIWSFTSLHLSSLGEPVPIKASGYARDLMWSFAIVAHPLQGLECVSEMFFCSPQFLWLHWFLCN